MDSVNRRGFLTMTACGLAGLATRRGFGAETARGGRGKPLNFLVIMADDLGAKELSCYGNQAHRTPHLDQLAETGVRFDTCYATPLCHPTRFMLMTGQYGCHNGVYNFAGRRGGPFPGSAVEDIGANHTTFAEVLKPAGYATVLAGKWQLSGELPTLIRDCGFDEYCMWAYVHNLPKGVKHTGGFEGGDKTSRYWNPCIVKNGEYMPTKPDDYGPDIYCDFLIDFIERHKDGPFFAYYPMCLTHAPHLPTPDNVQPGEDRYKGSNQNYKGAVEYMDKLVGRLVAALDKLGLRENTVIFFTGDNGTGGDGKGQPTELGARVPMIVNGPGIVKARGASRELTDLSDVLPTLADLAGAPLSDGLVVDGVSYAPYLRGQSEKMREWIFSYLGDSRILRTKRWLLEDNTPFRFGRLYDCGESRDDSGYKEVTESEDPEVAAIKERFNALLAKLPAPVLPAQGDASEVKPEGLERRGKKHDAKGVAPESE